ncbi:MAG: DUF1826 domain-containing protein [Crocinitomicaceae bacterium]|nr:DUF1826 domain-containing protein [Crocinitomicaceae bacterium]
MKESCGENHIYRVNSFRELVSTPFEGEKNAMCWSRKLNGDFKEIIYKIELDGDITTISPKELRGLQLSEQGNIARDILLNDLALFTAHGSDPILNVIKQYERDDAFPFFPTDVYSFHVDRSPVPVDTFLCTYHGTSSEIIPNAHAEQKILIPEIRTELQKIYNGPEAGFEDFLTENFFDLHYEDHGEPITLGQGHVWKLAIDHPNSSVLPSIHRAPKENKGEPRLLLIC